ncbi:hypothetical protein [Alloalcanivorax xenomutans]|uniref:hypothetical protein n=1 Tax=Alloalcanivorax xenomutans TaxID=1094342 RepID=UPI003BAA7B7C
MNKWACLISAMLLSGCGGGGGSASGGGDGGRPGDPGNGGGDNGTAFLSWNLEVDEAGHIRTYHLNEALIKIWLEDAGEVSYPGHFYAKKPLVNDVEYMLLKLMSSGTDDGEDHWYIAALDRVSLARELLALPVDGLAAAHGLAEVDTIQSATGLFDAIQDTDGALRFFMVTSSTHWQNGQSSRHHVLSRYRLENGQLVLESHDPLSPSLALAGQSLALGALEVLGDYIVIDSYTGTPPNISNVRFHLLNRDDLSVARDSFAQIPRAYGYQLMEGGGWLHLIDREREEVYNERDGVIERYVLHDSPEFPTAESMRSRIRSYQLSELLAGSNLPTREHLLPACDECMDNNGGWYEQRVASNAIIAGDDGRVFMAYSRKPAVDQPGEAIAVEVMGDQVAAGSDFATSLRGDGDAVKTDDELSRYYRQTLSFMKPAPDGGFYLMTQTMVDTENHNSLDSQYLTLFRFDRDGRRIWVRKIDARGNPGRFANATVSALEVREDGVRVVVTGDFDVVDDTAGTNGNAANSQIHFVGDIGAAAAASYQSRREDLTAFSATGPSLAEALPGNSYYYSLDSGSAFWIRFEQDKAFARSWYGGFDESYVVLNWQEGQDGIHRQHQTVLICHPGETQWREVDLPPDQFSPLTGSRGGIVMDGKDMNRTSQQYPAVSAGQACNGYGA